MRNLWLVVLLLLHRSHYVYSNAEGDALHDFKSQLTDPHNVLQSWNATFVNPCTWFHVTCDNDNYVIRVDLGNAQLSGPLVSSLGKITRLQYLELYGNNLTGSIPAELGNLSNLISLDLYQNNFTSVIPDTLGNLLKLRYLRLNNNSLSGSIPVSLTNINNLQILDLSNNNLSGSVPTNGSFSHFTSISFQNNPHLCGQAVNKQCPGEPPLASPPSYSPGSPNCSQGGQS